VRGALSAVEPETAVIRKLPGFAPAVKAPVAVIVPPGDLKTAVMARLSLPALRSTGV
jgi:hypothetical protein